MSGRGTARPAGETAGAPGAQARPGETREALVARVDFGGCVLLRDDGTTLDATVRGKLMGPRKALGNAVVVGDRVRVETERERALVAEVLPRRNAFSRLAPGRAQIEQVVAANIDQVVLVTSLANPEFSPGLADRILCQAEHAGIPARLVLNKVDLGDARRAQEILTGYRPAGTPGHPLCAKSGAGVDELRHALLGRRSLMVGHSGVGKSTLLNTLVPGLSLLAGEVNPVTGKGRHTTSAAWLLRPEPGLELIDTPGVRAFGLWGIGPRDLDQAYPEFRPWLGACRFSDCRHAGEPGCALAEAAASGEVPALRFESYRKLRAELEDEARD